MQYCFTGPVQRIFNHYKIQDLTSSTRGTNFKKWSSVFGPLDMSTLQLTGRTMSLRLNWLLKNYCTSPDMPRWLWACTLHDTQHGRSQSNGVIILRRILLHTMTARNTALQTYCTHVITNPAN